MIIIKKIEENSCRGCVNDGKGVNICMLFNELTKRDCGSEKLIYKLQGGFFDDDTNGTETTKLLHRTS